MCGTFVVNRSVQDTKPQDVVIKEEEWEKNIRLAQRGMITKNMEKGAFHRYSRHRSEIPFEIPKRRSLSTEVQSQRRILDETAGNPSEGETDSRWRKLSRVNSNLLIIWY